MSDWREELVRIESKKVRDKLAAGVLMGEPIDMDNPDELVWCAYMMGKQEAESAAFKDAEFLRQLQNRAHQE